MQINGKQTEWLSNNIHATHSFTKAHSNSIETISLNPSDTTQLASGSHDKLVKVWDINKMSNTLTLRGHTQGVWASAFAADGKLLFTGSPDNTVIAWDLKKEKPAAQLKGHINKVYWVKLSEDGKLMLSGGEDGRVIMWDMRKMEQLKTIQVSKGIIYNASFLPGSQMFMCCDNQGILRVYDSTDFQLKASSSGGSVAAESYIAADGQINIVTGQNKTLKHYQLTSPNQIDLQYQLNVHSDSIMSMAIDEQMLITGCRDGSARVWQMGSGKVNVICNLLDHKQNISGVVFVPKKSIVATCSWDQDIKLYKI